MENAVPKNKPSVFLGHLVRTARTIEILYPFVDPAMFVHFLQTVQQLPAVFDKVVKQMGVNHNLHLMNRKLAATTAELTEMEAQFAVQKGQLDKLPEYILSSQAFCAIALWFQYFVRSE